LEWETVLDKLKDGKTHQPDVCVDGVFPSCDAFGLGRKRQERHEHANRMRFLGNISRTAMYLVVLMKVPACKPMSSPEMPKVAKLDNALL